MFMVCTNTLCFGQVRPLDRKMDIEATFEKIEVILEEISMKTKVYFSYNSSLFRENQRFTVNLRNETVDEILTVLLVDTNLGFKEVNDQIIIFKKSEEALDFTYSIAGKVLDKYSEEPVVGVNVFIAGTLKGSSTNLDGEFEITEVLEGSYELAASHISYEIDVAKVNVNGANREINYQFTLTPKINQLKELKVVSLKYKEWDKYYGIFKQEFLGSTNNARKCEIVNPEVLDFEFNDEKQTVVVKAYKPLIILNMSLGYELDYYLDYFEMGSGSTRSRGVSNFKELDPKNERERKQWMKNRLKSYHGSLNHFLRSLVANQIEEEGFKISAVDELPAKKDVKDTKINIEEIMRSTSSIDRKKMSFDNYLKIVYTKENESSAYVDEQIRYAMGYDPFVQKYYNNHLRRGVSLGKQVSFMKLNYPNVTVNSRGFFKESLAVTTFGYWSWERVAEYLPFEYQPM
ncbi:MAG: carboxypeptidase-like regulatory domain-containing protein [Cyclobacteriaceae bacterium]